ncbi:hypothetical protein DsansV1_C06g0068151 [Dioscorea sansibarensis]
MDPITNTLTISHQVLGKRPLRDGLRKGHDSGLLLLRQWIPAPMWRRSCSPWRWPRTWEGRRTPWLKIKQQKKEIGEDWEQMGTERARESLGIVLIYDLEAMNARTLFMYNFMIY